ncbi:MAG: enolase C-terminal domain-like protein [Burkholderiaceae bacterium]
MTIRSIDSVALNLPFEIYGPRPQFAGKDRFMEILLVRVETDSGLVGWGEAFGFGIWPATRAPLHAMVAPLALGRDERDIAGLMNDLNKKLHIVGRTGATVYALAGLDIAQPSVTKIGGISPMMEIVALARQHKVMLTPQCPYFGPNPLGDAIEVRNGYINVPQGPGLGRDPDPAVLAQYSV